MTTQTSGPDWFSSQEGGRPPGPGAPGPAPTPTGPAPDVLDAGPAMQAAASGQQPQTHELTPDDDLLDDWAPPRRVNRLTAALGVAVVAACAFTVGASAQKHLGAATTSAATSRAGFTRGQVAGGFGGGGGGFGAGQRAPAGRSGQAGPSASAGAGEGTGQAAPAAPSVVGTVKSVDGTDLVVENFAGALVTVHVPAATSVTAPGLSGVVAGMTVSVVGTKSADGSVVATAVVARKA